MSERAHPLEEQAHALVDDARFCEWLDSIAALDSGWPHSRYSARHWLQQQCEIHGLGYLATDPAGARTFGQIARRFAVWDRNQELGL